MNSLNCSIYVNFFNYNARIDSSFGAIRIWLHVELSGAAICVDALGVILSELAVGGLFIKILRGSSHLIRSILEVWTVSVFFFFVFFLLYFENCLLHGLASVHSWWSSPSLFGILNIRVRKSIRNSSIRCSIHRAVPGTGWSWLHPLVCSSWLVGLVH